MGRVRRRRNEVVPVVRSGADATELTVLIHLFPGARNERLPQQFMLEAFGEVVQIIQPVGMASASGPVDERAFLVSCPKLLP